MKRAYNITVIKGDGIGPEVVDETIKVLDAVCQRFDIELKYTYCDAGGCAYDKYNTPLPQDTLDKAKAADAVLLGAVGGVKWDNLPSNDRPEMALLGLRKGLGLFANLRPAILFDELKDACPLKSELIENGLDILVVRELTGGIYFGEKTKSLTSASDTLCYSVDEVKRIAKVGFESSMKRDKKLCSVDKANILESSRLWRKTVIEMSKDYPEVELSHLYVDNAAMQLVKNPAQFDVIVTGNMFGDILSDEAAMLTGSIGMLASASINEGKGGMYEPVHGSAPDIAGLGIANPIATILSAAMMLKYTLSENEAAAAIEDAVQKALKSGARTGDIAIKGEKVLSCVQMGDCIRSFC